MIDKQKLLQWIEDKKYVFAVEDYDHRSADDSPEEIAEWKGCMKILNALDMNITAGTFDVEEVAHERSEASSTSAART